MVNSLFWRCVGCGGIVRSQLGHEPRRHTVGCGHEEFLSVGDALPPGIGKASGETHRGPGPNHHPEPSYTFPEALKQPSKAPNYWKLKDGHIIQIDIAEARELSHQEVKAAV